MMILKFLPRVGQNFPLRVGRHRFGNLLSCLLLFIVCFHADASNSRKKITFTKTNCTETLPECECRYHGIIELFCQNVSNFQTFSRKLSNGSVFQVNSEFRITLSGARVLPRRFLNRLILFELCINDTKTEIVEDGAFDGLLQLNRFTVKRSSVKVLPDFRPIRNSLLILNLKNSLLTSVEGDHLKNLKVLDTLSLSNNLIVHVGADAFQGTENLMVFDLSYNLLQSLPPNLFDPWKKLKTVSLSNNHLLHVNELFAVTNPQFVNLGHNNLTDLDTVFHPNMTFVETIQLSNNPISKVTPNTFSKLNRTRSLYLDHCLIQEFDPRHYEGLKSLSTLDLSYNLIEMVADQVIAFGNGVKLVFTGNRIREFKAKFSYVVKRIYLDKNLMTTVGQALQYSQLSEVSLADNKIQSLESENFLGLHQITSLNLQGNLISSIERETFTDIRKELLYLDLSRNKLRKLNGCVQSLSLLVGLKLTDNQIEILDPDDFKGLNDLVYLHLQGNSIQTLGLEVQGLSSLQKLNVSHNRIRTITGDQLPRSLRYVSVNGNPLQCDCQIWTFLQRLNTGEYLKTDMPPCILSTNTSAVAPARCPEGCQCFCTNNASDHHISVNCSSIGLIQLPSIFSAVNEPSLEEHNFTSILVYLSPNMEDHASFAIQDKIGSLDFSHNNLQSMEDARLPKETKNLCLHHNLLRQPPLSLFQSLERLRKVTLSRNPWDCNCETSAFRKWIMSHSEVILDVNETRCDPDDQVSPELANLAIWVLTDKDLCQVDIKTTVLIVLGVLCFVLAVIAMMVLFTRYEMVIKIWLYDHGVTRIKEQDLDQDKVYDAFISYSYKDQNTVIPELVTVIQETAPNLRLCLHYLDFIAGVYIAENIYRAVESSKQTVIFLSRDFLESEWCMFELKAAREQALKDSAHRIIIIKFGDLPKESEMPREVQKCLKSSTCITWGDKHFWKYLLFHLPTPSSTLT